MITTDATEIEAKNHFDDVIEIFLYYDKPVLYALLTYKLTFQNE